MRELGVPACSGAFRGVQVVFRFVPVVFWWYFGDVPVFLRCHFLNKTGVMFKSEQQFNGKYAVREAKSLAKPA